ncbi:MAG: serine/threonine protein kinase [Candidatus Xenobiia bacterium LiM19]
MAQFNPGERVQEKYIVKSLLGEGGMNRVYLVQEGTEFRALKVSKDPAELGQQYVNSYNQFLKEISILTTISHKGLPKVYDYFVIGNVNCVVEEYIEGRTLEELLRKKRPRLPEILSWGIALCEILEVLHRNEIVFRDLKPANIMCANDGTIKLIDFDIARVYKAGNASDTEMLGTPGYAPPEMYGAVQSDQRADIYSLGATLHRCIAGIDPEQKPFHFDPLGNHRRGLPQSLERVIEKALKHKRDERYATIAEFKKELEEVEAVLKARSVSPGAGSAAGRTVTQYSQPGSKDEFVNLISIISIAFFIIMALIQALFPSSHNPADSVQSIAREPVINRIASDLDPLIIPPDKWNFQTGEARELYPDTFQYKTEELYDSAPDMPSVTFNEVLESRDLPLKVQFAFPVQADSVYPSRPQIYIFSIYFAIPMNQMFMSREGCFYSIPGKVLVYNLSTENKWDGDSSNTRIIVKKDGTVKGNISWEPSSSARPLRFWGSPPYSGPMVLMILKGPCYGWRYTKSFIVN